MTYTINGKPYTEFDIRKRCAEILAWESEPNVKSVEFDRHNCFWVEHIGFSAFTIKYYLSKPADTWVIIEKCWDELNESTLRNGGRRKSHWQDTMQQHNCTKLVAACICFIEVNDQ